MPDIVVTEFLDPGPLEVLKKNYAVHIDTGLWNKRPELEALVKDAAAVIVRNRTQVDKALLAAAPTLKVVGRLGVGLDNIDMPACKARGITVCPAIGANAVSVAEWVIGSILMLSRFPAFTSSHRLADGAWLREETGRGQEIAGKTLGIIGFGNIGQTVGARGRAMGMRVIAFDDYVPAGSPAWNEAERVTLAELLAESDCISLHCPLTPETRGMIGTAQFRAMKKGTILTNAARGGVVDEQALADALKAGQISGAAMDVFDKEPIDKPSAAVFQGVPNLILTPHIAGVTLESNERISTVTVENVLNALQASAS